MQKLRKRVTQTSVLAEHKALRMRRSIGNGNFRPSFL